MCEDRDRVAADDLAVTRLDRHAHDAGVVEEEQLAAVCSPGGPGAAVHRYLGACACLDAGYLDLEHAGGARIRRPRASRPARAPAAAPIRVSRSPAGDGPSRDPTTRCRQTTADGARYRPAIGRLPTMSLARWRTRSRRAPAERRPIRCRPCRCSPPLSGSTRTQSSGSRATRSARRPRRRE